MVNKGVPFLRNLDLTFEEVQPGFYSIQSTMSPEQWISTLFFLFEPHFYGLTTTVQQSRVILSTAELLELFSPNHQHPFLQIDGQDEFSKQLLSAVKAIQPLWNNEALWDYAEINTLESNQQTLTFVLPENFSNDDYVQQCFQPFQVDDQLCKNLLTTGVQQKLYSFGLSIRDISTLLPYFKDGGWPLQREHTIGDVNIALRLREPDQSDDWILETVLLKQNSEKVWTPAVKKRHLPIADALLSKWKPFAKSIEQHQQKIIDLLNIHEHTAKSFLFVPLTDENVRKLLKDDFKKLNALGYEVILPSWFKNLKPSKVHVHVQTSNHSQKSVAGLDDLLSFEWQLSIGGEQLSKEEFQKIVDEKREFLRVGNKWFTLDTQWMNTIRQLIEKTQHEDWTVRDLLFQELPEQLSALDEADEERDDPLFAFEMQRSLQHLVEQLQQKQGLPSLAPPTSLQATLRPYQQQGFEWLVFMRNQQFGAILADDMGLGKTVQLISYLLYIFEHLQVENPAIIICPTSVLGNWQKEFKKFAPTLKVHTHYGSSRFKGEAFLSYIERESPRVILTSYGTISQDIDFLKTVHWSMIGVDEAQNIKNMHTLQSRSIRKLKGEHHIALTGTPIENRLSELWAIFDFIHKGYLGSFPKFQEQFIIPIERDDSNDHKQMLRTKIRPFLLRRTKNDPELMLNLPEKQESKEFCPLTKEQAALYENYIQETLQQLHHMTGFEKKGRILQMLSKLKQLCNHPALYLKEPFEDATSLLSRSIKLERIVQLAAEIAGHGEQCLIFTQYIGMGHLLQYCFSELYHIKAPFLTGSTPKQQRDQFVESFQNGEFPIFILSLKAGGTGLNLTAASHVLHADRWWNPAVENQATDRAYRIGQTQFVQVHKFITIGTIEEKIDNMIEMKMKLSKELIQSSNWLTELQEEELLDLVTLDMTSIN